MLPAILRPCMTSSHQITDLSASLKVVVLTRMHLDLCQKLRNGSTHADIHSKMNRKYRDSTLTALTSEELGCDRHLS